MTKPLSDNPRNIKTEFYDSLGEVVRVTYAVNPNGAVMRAFHGILVGWDGAVTAQVFEQDTAAILTEITRSKDGEIITPVKYDPNMHDPAVRRKNPPKRTLAALFTPSERKKLAHLMNGNHA